MVNLLIDQGANVNVKNKKEVTPLIYTTFEGNNKIIESLIEAGANIDSKDKNGITPLMAPAMKDNLKAVQLLLNKEIVMTILRRQLYLKTLKKFIRR